MEAFVIIMLFVIAVVVYAIIWAAVVAIAAVLGGTAVAITDKVVHYKSDKETKERVSVGRIND